MTKGYIAIIVIATLLAGVIEAQETGNFQVDEYRDLRWNKKMEKNPEYWLNAGMVVLLKTGMDAGYIPELLSKGIPHNADDIYRVQALAVLSLPMSLVKRPELPGNLANIYQKLKKTSFKKDSLRLFRRGTFPDIDSREKLKANEELVKNALQLLALTTLDGKGFPEPLNEKFLFFVDRGIFYYTVWRDSPQTDGDLDAFFKNISKTLNPAVNMLTANGKKEAFKGIEAVLVAELNFLKSLFKFRRTSWEKYIRF